MDLKKEKTVSKNISSRQSSQIHQVSNQDSINLRIDLSGITKNAFNSNKNAPFTLQIQDKYKSVDRQIQKEKRKKYLVKKRLTQIEQQDDQNYNKEEVIMEKSSLISSSHHANKKIIEQQQSNNKFRSLLEQGQLPQSILKTFDYDRIQENIEDFISTDRLRKIALNSNLLKPQFTKDRSSVISRSIVGNSEFYEQARKIFQERSPNKQQALRKLQSSQIGSQVIREKKFQTIGSSQGKRNSQLSQTLQFSPQKQRDSVNTNMKQVQIKKENLLVNRSQNIQQSSQNIIESNSNQKNNEQKQLLSLIEQFPAKIDQSRHKQLLQNSNPLDDEDLKNVLKQIDKRNEDFQQKEQMIELNQSLNLNNFKYRNSKMLRQYQNYQKVWKTNLKKIDEARNKLNMQGLCKNYKANKEQAMKGDFTIHERQDEFMLENSNREVVNSVLRCEEDAYAQWVSSLRQHEHDCQYDGIPQLDLNSFDYQIDPDYNDSDSIFQINASQNVSQYRSMLKEVSKIQNTLDDKQQFKKKRFQYDQSFICEDDLPLTKRRFNIKYLPCQISSSFIKSQLKNQEQPTDASRIISAPNQFQGKYVLQIKAPGIAQEIKSKPQIFKTRYFQLQQENMNETQQSTIFLQNKSGKQQSISNSVQKNMSLRARSQLQESYGNDRYTQMNESQNQNSNYSQRQQTAMSLLPLCKDKVEGSIFFQSRQGTRNQQERKILNSTITNFAIDQAVNRKNNSTLSKYVLEKNQESELSSIDTIRFNQNFINADKNSQRTSVFEKFQDQIQKPGYSQIKKYQIFKDKAKAQYLDVETLKKRLPCSLEAVDHLDEIYVEGQSVLASEIRSALSIPEYERRIIDKQFLYQDDKKQSQKNILLNRGSMVITDECESPVRFMRNEIDSPSFKKNDRSKLGNLKNAPKFQSIDMQNCNYDEEVIAINYDYKNIYLK